jgi:hypothetical protein
VMIVHDVARVPMSCVYVDPSPQPKRRLEGHSPEKAEHH